jgi:hypothetical protein
MMKMDYVIPAKAGNHEFEYSTSMICLIPAFAGMTAIMNLEGNNYGLQ